MKNDNLNRIRGILSARQGAQVPKFGGGKAIYKATLDNQTLYSLDGNSWYTNENLEGQLATLSNEQLASVQANKISLSREEPVSVQIVGGADNINGNPQAAEQHAEKVQKAKDEIAVKEEAETIIEAEQAKQNTQGTTGNNSQVSEGFQTKLSTKRQEKMAKVDPKTANNWGKVGQFASAAIQGIGDALGAKQSATDSELTKGLDTAYDVTTSAVSQFSPAAGAIMSIAGATGDIMQEITGGNDQMTAADKVMSSKWLSWLPTSAINDIWGKKSDAFATDVEALATVGSSYGGTAHDISEAAQKADKKYGLFSEGARKKANAVAKQVESRQNIMSSVADTANDQRLAVQSMGEQAGLAYSMMTDGGYNQKYTYAAKQGGVINQDIIEFDWTPSVTLNWELPTFKDGGSVEFVEKLDWVPEFKEGGKTEEYPTEYLEFKASLPDNQRNTSEDDYRTYLYWQLWGKPKNFQYTLEHPDESGNYMYTWDNSDNSYHASTIAWKDGVGYFMKPKHHSTLNYELDWYNKGLVTEEGGKQREMTPEERKEWEEFKSNYELVDDGEFYKYIPKNKKGGSLGDSDIPEIEETTQKNVIPEGALHKNKHHMEHAEGLTKKGIPVVDEDGEQQAEIEHSEIIFTLEVTKKLEEYYEIFYSENATNKEKEQAALDAGKLLVYQILENTEDRTGLIEACKQGGSLTLQKSTDNLI